MTKRVLKISRQYRKYFLAIEKDLEKLTACPQISRDSSELPDQPGVYLFLEGDKPIYVGRAKSIRKRVLQHSRPSSSHFGASFAYILAKKLALKRGIRCSGTRAEVSQQGQFAPLFQKCRERIARMSVKFVVIHDADQQAIFKICAARAFETPHNSFETH